MQLQGFSRTSIQGSTNWYLIDRREAIVKLTEQCRKIFGVFLVGKGPKSHFLDEFSRISWSKGHLLFIPQWYS